MKPCNFMLVDASIARSATDPARHPVSESCLELVRKLDDKTCMTGLAMTPQLETEWRKHASTFMTSWYVAMISRLRVRTLQDHQVSDLRKAIERVVDDGVRTALLKDLHLSEAAIYYAVPVASRDDRQRRYLTEIAEDYALAANIQWLNPTAEANWAQWVLDGCVDRVPFRCTAE